MATLLLLSNLAVGPAHAAGAGLVHISVSTTGGPSEGDVYHANPSISSDGRFVAFQSSGPDLVPTDTNSRVDVFVRDRDTDGDGIFDETGAVQTRRVSVSSAGVQGNGDSTMPAISANGRFVAFRSLASTLVAGDTNANPGAQIDGQDVFVHDLLTSATTRVSVTSAGVQGNRDSGSTEGYGLGISADGRWVAFGSEASNLVTNDLNSWEDVFVHDRQTGATTRVSFAPNRAQTKGHVEFRAISPDGRWVVMRSGQFLGTSEGGIHIYVHDRDPDKDGVFDETDTYALALISRATGGQVGNHDSHGATISADGRYVAFYSNATNLVASDTNFWSDLFIRDRDVDADGIFDETGAVLTTRANVSSEEAQANDVTYENANPGMSADGRYVTFSSRASNLVPNDTASTDTFVRDLQAGITDRVSVTSTGLNQSASSYYQAISPNGGFVAFSSASINLAATDTRGNWDLFVTKRDATPPETTITSGPARYTNNQAATIAFSANEAGTTFYCSMDGGPFTACVSPRSFSNLPVGTHTFQVRAVDVANNVDASPASHTWTVDRTAPAVQGPTHRFANGRSAVGSDLPVTLNWKATDPSGVAAYELQQRDPAGPFVPVSLRAPGATNHTLLLQQEPHRFQVRAQDRATNWSLFKQGPEFTVSAVQQDNRAINYEGTWQTQTVANAFGGTVKASKAAGATARYSFTGAQIAWLATKGPNRGTAEVWLDGKKVATVDLYAATAKPATIVWTRGGLSTRNAHTLEIRVLGEKRAASSGTWVDVDGFGVIR